MTDVGFLGRVHILATHESSPSGDDSFGVAQQLLHDPGAAASENRNLGVVAHLHLHPRRKIEATSGRPSRSTVKCPGHRKRFNFTPSTDHPRSLDVRNHAEPTTGSGMSVRSTG